MDDFDVFNQPSQVTSTNAVEITDIPEDDLFGGESTTETQSFNTHSENQTTYDSWSTDNNLNDTETTQTQLFTDESTTNAYDSFATNQFQQDTNDTLTNDTQKFQSEETSSYDMFSPPVATVPVTAATIFTTGISSDENLSALEAFNRRRQQEIAEKDAEENKKKNALKEQAKQDIERWYNERKNRMNQNRQTIDNAEFELRQKALETSDRNNCDWSKLIRFLEFTTGTQLSKGKRDLSRMKASILNAKRDSDKRQSVNSA